MCQRENCGCNDPYLNGFWRVWILKRLPRNKWIRCTNRMCEIFQTPNAVVDAYVRSEAVYIIIFVFAFSFYFLHKSTDLAFNGRN